MSRSKKDKDKNKPREEEPPEVEVNIDSLLRDAVTQTADAKYAMLANGGMDSGKEKAVDETVLDNGSHGSPKIVLTTPKLPTNGPDTTRALEKVNSMWTRGSVGIFTVSCVRALRLVPALPCQGGCSHRGISDFLL